ncbi:MAG: hypothetical protein ACTSQE_13735 [Candidatus Heimdallarchaeaceae archaeon]
MISEDVINHVYYSSWIAMALFMFSLFAFPTTTSTNMIIGVIIGMAFDFVIILLGIGIIRLGRETIETKNANIVGYFLIGGSVIDIIKISLYIFLNEQWMEISILLFRLCITLSYYILIVIAFILLKKLMDKLYDRELILIKKHPYLAIGYILMTFGYIIAWVNDYLNEQLIKLGSWVAQISFFFMLGATFFIILGFFNFSFVIRSLKEKAKQDALET